MARLSWRSPWWLGGCHWFPNGISRPMSGFWDNLQQVGVTWACFFFPVIGDFEGFSWIDLWLIILQPFHAFSSQEKYIETYLKLIEHSVFLILQCADVCTVSQKNVAWPCGPGITFWGAEPGHSSFWPCSATTLSPGLTIPISCRNKHHLRTNWWFMFIFHHFSSSQKVHPVGLGFGQCFGNHRVRALEGRG